ncbi:hypothetical protein, partial [Bilophila wadsworthia]|uniref:hypothetical protein n=1 Tax=Bilophila wadsworthia TaxID=35833 RepID=UPI00307ED428
FRSQKNASYLRFWSKEGFYLRGIGMMLKKEKKSKKALFPQRLRWGFGKIGSKCPKKRMGRIFFGTKTSQIIKRYIPI